MTCHCNTSDYDCRQGRDCPARRQRYSTPQGEADRRAAEQIAADSVNAALIALAWVLAAIVVGIGLLIAVPWLLDRAGEEAARAAVVMRF
jgi:aryl-alcohol dehydrogenase-like predicted oxidoreductase